MTNQLTALTVASVMTRNPVTVAPHTPFKDIVELLADRRISAVPVVSATGIVVGEVSEVDLLGDRLRRTRGRGRRRGSGRLTATELMTSPVVTVASDATLSRAAKLLSGSGRRHLSVVDDGRLVGVLARRDVLRVFSRPDKEICAEIEHDVFEHRMMAQPRSVRVSVDRGVVLLTGRLPCRSDIATAVALIAETPGVIDVNDHLECVNDNRPARHR